MMMLVDGVSLLADEQFLELRLLTGSEREQEMGLEQRQGQIHPYK